MKRVWGFVFGVFILFLASTNAWAQAGASAQVSGIVKDSSGAVLPGVDVTATQTDTGLKRNAVTAADGSYTIINLSPGPYQLEATLQGFRTFQQKGIVLQVGASPVVNVTMSIGAVAETITVQASTPLVETKNIGVGQVMDNKRILELPLNGRNSADLIAVLPGAVSTPGFNATSRSMGGSNGGIAYSIAGGLSFGVSYVLDGAMHNNPYDNLNLPLPFPDALGEFKAETSALTAQNGMHSGAAVNAITKSGSNSFRGDGFEFFRHHSMNATDPFTLVKNADGTRKDDGLKRNQYGATIGGPIKTDKLFFFAGYQGTNTRVNPVDNRAFVPTAAMLAGDFTAFASPACNAGVQRNLLAPFVGNKISPALFSPAALKITAKLTPANTPDQCGLVQFPQPASTDEWQQVTKVDYQLNNKHRIFGRYIGTSQFTSPPFSLPDAQQNLLVTRTGGRDNLATTMTVGEDYVISPTTLNSVRFAYNRTAISRTSTDFFSAPEVGINIYSYMPHYMLLTVTNGFQLGGGTESLSTFVTNAYQFSDDVTLVRGAHQFAVGVNVARWSSLSLANVRSPGQFSIDGTQTGLGLADFMLGKLGTNGLIQSAPNTLDMAQTYFGVYAQDTWRVGTKVTLNLGVRYEPFLPQQLQNGAVYQFDQARFNANVHSTVFPNAPAGMYFPGDTGFPSKAGMNTQWGNIGPRVGVAYDPNGDGKTSIRASYGRSYEFVNAQFHLNTAVAPPWGSEIRINSPSGGLDNPFINSAGQTNIFPVTFDQKAPFSLNGPFLSLSNDMASTRVDLWNVTLERQITPVWFASAGYLGSKTSNIWESVPLNNAVSVAGVVSSTANINARRPFTLQDPVNGKFFGPVDLYVTDGNQRYNGMILTLRRTSARTSLAANYTLSHCYGSPDGGGGTTTNVSTGYNQPGSPAYDDGNCTADRLHSFSMTGSIESPRFEQRTWNAIASGWRLVGSFRATTGPWLTISTNNADRMLNGQAGTQRANQILDNVAGDLSVNATGNIQYLNSAAFAVPALGTFGNTSRNIIRGPDSKSLDMALTRSFRLKGSQAIEIRCEAFNAMNWLEWGNPNTGSGAATFGQISSVGVAPRVLQLAAKFTF